MSKKIDYTGKVFGRLRVVELSRKDPKGGYLWWCECTCGNKKEVSSRAMSSGSTKSCGCLKIEVNSSHGMSYSTEAKTWYRIKDRCCNPNSHAYSRYGERGITVCNRWLESFENFYEDMGDKPSPNHSIERLDVNKGYSPDNCVWTTTEKQNRNVRKRVNNTSGCTGVSRQMEDGKVIAYVASWMKLDGKRKTKYFSVNKYGEDGAFLLACEVRNKAIGKLNKQGAGYTDGHGK